MRITIGTDDQMDALFDFLKNYMDVNKKKL